MSAHKHEYPDCGGPVQCANVAKCREAETTNVPLLCAPCAVARSHTPREPRKTPALMPLGKDDER